MPKKTRKKVSAKRAEEIVRDHYSVMANLLQVPNAKVSLVLDGSDTEIAAKHYLEIYDKKLAGVCFTEERGTKTKVKERAHNIYLFQEHMIDAKDTLATLFHELLHARISELTAFIPENKRKKAHDVEEQFVRDVERTFIAYAGIK